MAFDATIYAHAYMALGNAIHLGPTQSEILDRTS